MQVYSASFLKKRITNKNKRVETLICLENIPHDVFDDVSFGVDLDYEVLGVCWKNLTYVVMNDWGEPEEISFTDPRFRIEKIAEDSKYPENLLWDFGMNEGNEWKWFD